MDKKIVIEYDPITDSISLDTEGFTTFEALGLLEVAKGMVIEDWYRED